MFKVNYIKSPESLQRWVATSTLRHADNGPFAGVSCIKHLNHTNLRLAVQTVLSG